MYSVKCYVNVFFKKEHVFNHCSQNRGPQEVHMWKCIYCYFQMIPHVHLLRSKNLSFPIQQIKHEKSWEKNAVIVEDLSKKKSVTVLRFLQY